MNNVASAMNEGGATMSILGAIAHRAADASRALEGVVCEFNQEYAYINLPEELERWLREEGIRARRATGRRRRRPG